MKSPQWLAAMRGGSLRVRLAVILAMALALPAVAAGIGAYSDYSDERATAERDLLQTARLLTLDHQNLIDGARKFLATLAADNDVRLMSEPACSLALRNAASRVPDYDLVTVVDAQGNFRCASARVQLPPDINRPWFRQVINGNEFVVSNLLTSRVFQEPAIVAAAPLFAIPTTSTERKTIGTVFVTVRISTLGRLPSIRNLPKDAFLTITDHQGDLAPLVKNSPPPPIPFDVTSKLINAAAGDGHIAVNSVIGPNGNAIVLAAAPLPPSGLYAILGRPAESLFGWLRVKFLAGIASPLLLWAIAVVTAWIVADRLVLKWIKQVRNMARNYVAGRPTNGSLHWDSAPAEIGELGAALTQLMQSVEARDAQLKEMVANRETLIKEIHHRVKNNLQIVSSLLNLQTRTLRDGPARDAVLSMRGRIAALALVHKSLYETNELQFVELDDFIENLCTQLQELAAVDHRYITVTTEVSPLAIESETAITLAMLIAEGVTNAIKHAFGGRASGRVLVKLETTSGNGVSLTIVDDGVGGFAAWASSGDVGGLGGELMHGYVRQLGGKMQVIEKNGTTISIDFPNLR